MAASFKKFKYVIAYYSRDEIDSTTPTQRKADTFSVETSSATRAITAFKRDPAAKDAIIVSVVPDDEGGKYDVGPVELQGRSGLLGSPTFT